MKSKIAVLLAVLIAQFVSAQVLWTGASGTDTNWSNGLNWNNTASPNNPPSSADNAQFGGAGATATVGTVNNVVDFNTTVATLQYTNISTSAGTLFHTTQINGGVTLTVTTSLTVGSTTYDFGIGGPSSLFVTTNAAAITGSAGTLAMNNSASGVLYLGLGTTNGDRAILDMSDLGFFNATLNQVLIGAPGVARASGTLYLAKTNTIVASFATAFTSSGTTTKNAGFEMGDQNANAGSENFVYFGLTNGIFANSVVIGKQKGSAATFFNPAFTNSNPTAFFRGSDKVSPVAVWSIADGQANTGGSTTPKGTNDFTGGTVDIFVNNLMLGRTSTGTPATRNSTGALLFGAGVVNVSTVTNGFQTASGGDTGIGVITINGPGTLNVTNVLDLGHVTGGAGTNGSFGEIHANGGTVRINTLVANSGSVSNAITLSNATLVVTNVFGPGVSLFAMTNSTVQLAMTNGSGPTFSTFNIGGTTNKISIASFGTVIPGYPAVLSVFKYSAANGTNAFNIGVGSLPAAFTGFISNDVANSAVDLVVTGGPAPPRNIIWSGRDANNGNIIATAWDISTTANWFSNATATTYNDNGGQGGDFVTFNDSGATGTVVLSTTVSPSGIAVSNNTVKYTISDNNSGFVLSGTGNLSKQGPGTLVLDNSGGVALSGGMTISNGTVQVGNNDGNGGVGSGNITDNGVLTINRNNAITIPGIISGTGSLNVTGTLSTVTLNGANTFSGQVTIYSNNTLKAGNAAALGATNGQTTINYGGSLDLAGRNLGQEPVVVSGPGVLNNDGSTNGAIYSSGVSITRALARVTMTGDTVIGAPSATSGFPSGGVAASNRWDIGSAGGTTGDPSTASLLMNGSAHNLVKAGANWIGIVSATVDPLLGNIDVQGGTLDIEGNTTGLGNTSANLNIRAGATLELFSATNKLNKQIQLDAAATVTAGAGADTIIGPMSIGGDVTIKAEGGATLLLSNTLSGAGLVTKDGSNTVIMAITDTHTGGYTVANGTLVLNTTNNNTSLLTVNAPPAGSQCILGGNGIYRGATDIEDTIWPGVAGKPSSLNLGNGSDYINPGNGDDLFGAVAIGFYSQGTAIFSLNTATTTGNGINDFVNVNGDFNANGSRLMVNPLTPLTNSSYTLLNYSGALNGTFNSPTLYTGLQASPSRYKFSLTQGSGHIILNVTATTGALTWNNAANNGAWDLTNSVNWFNANGGTNDYFAQLDAVVFDDTAPISATNITVAANNIPSGTNFLNLGLRPFSITIVSTNNNYALTGSKISGGTGILKKGPSTLTVGTLSNDFTGATVIAGGTVVVNATNALGAVTSPIIISNGATLDIGGAVLAANVTALGAKPVFVSGWGVSSNGAIVNGGPLQQQNALQNITLTGDTAFGGQGVAQGPNNAGRWDMRGGTPTLSTGGNAYNLYKVGTNQFSLVGVTVDSALADIHVFTGEFGIETTTTPNLGNSNNTVTIDSGASFEFFNFVGPLNKKIVANGGSVLSNTFNIWFNSGGIASNVVIGPVTITNGLVTVGGNGAGTFSNVVSGPGSFAKAGSGEVRLATANTYTGDTIVSNGTLTLLDIGSINNSPNFTLLGGTLNVGVRIDNMFTVSSGHTFSGIGTVTGSLSNAAGSTLTLGTNGLTGRLTVTTNAWLKGSTFLHLNASGNTNDLLSVGGNLTIGGSLNVSNVAGALAGGQSFKLFNAATYTTNYTGITPSTPGANLAWDASGLGVDGTLKVVSTGPGTFTNKPVILSFALNGANVTLTGTNGQAGDAYYLLTTTNLTSPWRVLSTNVIGSVGANGSFTYTGTNVVFPTEGQRFYILVNTNGANIIP